VQEAAEVGGGERADQHGGQPAGAAGGEVAVDPDHHRGQHQPAGQERQDHAAHGVPATAYPERACHRQGQERGEHEGGGGGQQRQPEQAAAPADQPFFAGTDGRERAAQALAVQRGREQAGQGEHRRQVQTGLDQRGQRPRRPDLAGQRGDRVPGQAADPVGAGDQPGEPDRQQAHRHHRDATVESHRGRVQRHVPSLQRLQHAGLIPSCPQANSDLGADPGRWSPCGS
jgi:hypothetical protein